MLEQNVSQGSYGTPVIMRMKKLIQKWMPMKNSHVLVVGSKLPWIEVLLLSLHVEKITTLDYNPFNSDHPRINTVSPMEMSTLVSNQREPMFDGMISFSSLEHSGLGRYLINQIYKQLKIYFTTTMLHHSKKYFTYHYRYILLKVWGRVKPMGRCHYDG